ncbi:hypothetical protein PR048_015974 [Dryococelus australis]|uniref:Uncharacterized protein n=1 Tax=Dryococelus australis TaxID=614101 RepID=A0ABQ9HIG0_9NEOP|nr:hypothetical protein PR048_015974 [Dryococelus australis]
MYFCVLETGSPTNNDESETDSLGLEHSFDDYKPDTESAPSDEEVPTNKMKGKQKKYRSTVLGKKYNNATVRLEDSAHERIALQLLVIKEHDHTRIERAMKKMDVEIRIPHDWFLFVKTVRSKNPFNVYEMKSLSEEEPFRQLDLRRNERGRPISLEISQIPPTYNAPVLSIPPRKRICWACYHLLSQPIMDSISHSPLLKGKHASVLIIIVKMMMKTESISHLETEKIDIFDFTVGGVLVKAGRESWVECSRVPRLHFWEREREFNGDVPPSRRQRRRTEIEIARREYFLFLGECPPNPVRPSVVDRALRFNKHSGVRSERTGWPCCRVSHRFIVLINSARSQSTWWNSRLYRGRTRQKHVGTQFANQCSPGGCPANREPSTAHSQSEIGYFHVNGTP